MDPFGIGITGLGAAGAATFGAFGLAFRARRRRLAAAQASSELAIAAATGEPAAVPEAAAPLPDRRADRFGRARESERDRIEAIATAQAELALRLDALTAAGSAPEEKLQAMAGQLLGLIRDKNATLETAMTGLDQLRARMKALEEMGEPAEARGLFEGLKGRMGELETRQAAAAAALEARLAALVSGGGASEIAERLARLHEARDAGLEAALARLAPLETRLAGLESGLGAGREATRRLEAAITALQGEQAQTRTALATLHAASEAAPARTEARIEGLRAEFAGRIEAFERALAARDPQAALDRFAERIEAVQDRLVLLETAENPLAEVSERLAGLYAQKDAAVETVLARLAPLETRLVAFEREIAAQDPQGALDRFAERLEGVQDRLMLIEATENPLAEVSERLSALYAQKDAAVEAVLGRLAPLEARLGGVEREIAGLDPQAALDRLAARVEAVQGRVSLIETAGNPLGEISERLAQIHAQKEAAVEAVLARLTPLEERLAAFEREVAAKDPQGAIEQLAARLEAVQGRVSLIETAGNPLGEISETLSALHAQKDAAVETVLARLTPIEARLAAFEREIAAKDPQGALARFAERLEGMAGRMSLIETSGSPLGELSETLAQIHAQKEAAVEAVLARLGPVEDRLGGVEREIAAKDPQGALDRFAERLEWVAGRLVAVESVESPLAEVTETLGTLYAQKEAAVEAVLARLTPFETRLADFEREIATKDPQGALDRFAERLDGVAGRLALVETAPAPLAEVTETLSALYAQKEAAVEAVIGRLAPLEAKLAAVEATVEGELVRAVERQEDDTRAAVDGLKNRIEVLQGNLGTTAAGLAALTAEGGAASAVAAATEAGLGGLAERLAALLAGRDAGLDSILDRLAPLEAMAERLRTLEEAGERIGHLEAGLEQLGPLAARVERLGALETTPDRLAAFEESTTGRLAALEFTTGRLAALEATVGRMAALEAAVERLASLEIAAGRLSALETAPERLLALETTTERLLALETTTERLLALEATTERLLALETMTERLPALETTTERLSALETITERLSALETTIEHLSALGVTLGRLGPLEVRLAALEARDDPEAARATAVEVAAELAALRADAAAQTALFANRLALLEANLPRLDARQAMLMRGAGPTPADVPAVAGDSGVPPGGASSEEEAIWALPRIISLHK